MNRYKLSDCEEVEVALRETLSIFDNESVENMIDLKKEGKTLGIYWYKRVTQLIRERVLFYRINHKSFNCHYERNKVDLISKLSKLDKDGYVAFSVEEIPEVEGMLKFLINLNIHGLKGYEEASFSKFLDEGSLKYIQDILGQLEVLQSRYFCFEYYCNAEDYERGFIKFTKGGFVQKTVDLKIMKDGNNEVD